MRMGAVLFIVGIMLLAGCGGAPQPSQPSQPAAPGNVSQPSGQPSAPAQPSQPSQPAQPSLAGMGFDQLAALGMPVRCTVTTTQNGTSVSMNLWLRGANFRSEMTPPGAAETFVTILKGNEMFVRASSEMKQAFAAMGKECDWLKITQQETAQPGAGEATSPGELEEIPPTNFQCAPDTFGDEKFATPGKVCDYASLLGGVAPPSTPSGGWMEECMSRCAELPSEQQYLCQQACAG